MYLLTLDSVDHTMSISGPDSKLTFPISDRPMIADLLREDFPLCLGCDAFFWEGKRCADCGECPECCECHSDDDDDDDDEAAS